MNFLVITIDALSKWYIDTYKNELGFFSWLDHNSITFENMYSNGPFTEAAIRGFWAGDKPLDGYSYLSESRFENDTIFSKFAKSHYMYYGKLIPYYNYYVKADNNLDREKCEERAFDHIWRARIKHYSKLFNNSQLLDSDISKLKLILDDFFDVYDKVDIVLKEKGEYEENKDKYILSILENDEQSSFFQNLTNDLFMDCRYSRIRAIEKQQNHELLANEAIFIKKAKDRNLEIAMANKANSLEDIEGILCGERNRCIISNNDLLFEMRDENEVLPKLAEEFKDFLHWHDEYANVIDRPFFAYIHNYDFHYPENIMNNRRGNEDKYVEEVEQLLCELDNVKNNNISVSKQICLKKIEDNLATFWKELEKRQIFDNTCVIFTADHGISNFMLPVKKSNSRWNYTRTNFNVPMYIKAPNIKNEHICELISSQCFGDIIESLNNSGEIDKQIISTKDDVIFTSWINGIPEIDRNTIKTGIRNNNWSITCEGYFFQTFSSLNIIGIYDLTNDPNEIKTIPYNQAINNKEFVLLFDEMGKKWFELIEKLVQDKLYQLIYGNTECLYQLRDIQEDFANDKRISLESFIDLINKKDIIIYGVNNYSSLDVLRYIPNNCNVKEYWSDNDTINKMYGYDCLLPHEIAKEIVVVVCESDEIKAISMLKNKGISNYIIFSNVQK